MRVQLPSNGDTEALPIVVSGDEELHARPLFKYTKVRWAEALLSRGSIRLETLAGFRDTRRYPPPTGDSGEGITKLHEHIPFGTGPTLSPLAQSIFGFSPGILVLNSDVMRPLMAPNYWIYSTSARCSAGVMRALRREACVRINDPLGFFVEIAAELIDRGLMDRDTPAQVLSCWYRSRSFKYPEGLHVDPAMIKEDGANVAEVRGIFTPLAPDRAVTEIFDAPALRSYCELVTDLPE